MKRFVLIFLLIFPFLFFSQERSKYDASRYIERMDNTLNIKFELDNDAESFAYNEGAKKYNIEPNITTRIVLATHYRFLTVKVGFAPKVFADIDSDKKGKTKVFKIQTDLYIKKWIQSFEYLKVKGYFINEFNLITGPKPPLTDYTTLPNLTTTSFGGITAYKFNDDFSLKAILNQTEIQRKTTGSVITSLHYGFFKMYDSSQGLDFKSFDLVLNTGYIHTFVINQKWYSSLGLTPGLGIEFNKLITTVEDERKFEKDNNFVFHLNTQLGLGYNSKSFYGGMFFKGVVVARGQKSLFGYDTVRGIFQIFVGYRFKTPEFVEDGFDWIEDQSPF